MMDEPAKIDAGAERIVALASLHVAVLLFGVAGLFGKWIDLPAATIVFGRTVIAAVALGAILPLARGGRNGFDWRMSIGGAVLALHWFAFFKAIQVADVATGLLGYASFPLFVLLLEHGLLRTRVRRIDWVIASLVVGGLVALVPEPRLDNHIVRGLAWGVLSGLAFAVLAISNRVLASDRTPGAIAFWQNVCAAVCVAPAALQVTVLPSARDVALLLILGLVCTALAHTLFIRSMRMLSAHTASVVAALEPVYGIALAAALLDEVPNPRTVLGALLIIGAVFAASVRATGMTPR